MLAGAPDVCACVLHLGSSSNISLPPILPWPCVLETKSSGIVSFLCTVTSPNWASRLLSYEGAPLPLPLPPQPYWLDRVKNS